MQYLLIINQNNGCDYTIGCGEAHEIFEASDSKAASQIAMRIVNEYCDLEELDILEPEEILSTVNENSESRRVDDIKLYQISCSVEMNLQRHFEDIENNAKAQLATDNEKREREQYTELKAKYE